VKWISCTLVDQPPQRKTKVWTVWSLQSAFYLGRVQWFSRWRRYCFFPNGQAAFEQDCLRDLAEFVESETKKHRIGKRASLAEVKS
jgi:hypothetical protein